MNGTCKHIASGFDIMLFVIIVYIYTFYAGEYDYRSCSHVVGLRICGS